MQIAFVLDVIIAVLLVLTITYAVRLNQRLAQLRSDKNELMELAKTFAEATVKAEAGIKALKISSEALQTDVQKAEALRDDLAYLVERGGRSADEMVASVRAPKSQRHDFSPEEEDEDLLIEEAIRAATPGAGGRPGGRADTRPGPRFGAKDDNSLARGETTRRVSLHPEPAPAQRSSEQRRLGGGLGGLSAQDRLLDKRGTSAEEPSIGDTDAARELLKALSSMK
ncbi:DUF6468 domain-containing protein [Magnetovibrio sp.]|uniref:DUF6468 domain-containing protein n=1 Tax=Magnetovibrio sp. TaxID=2024836 RepID=UPI002F9418F9